MIEKETPTKLIYNKNSVFMGDIFDVHCRKKDAKKMIDASDEHRRLCDNSVGIINIRGNHEGQYGNGLPEYVIERGVLYTHHPPFYSEKQKIKWYSKKAGISKKKFYGIKVLNFFRNMKGNKVSKKKLQTIAKYAIKISQLEQKVIHTVIVAHIHLSHDGKVLVVTEADSSISTASIKKFRVIVVNCGVTKVWF